MDGNYWQESKATVTDDLLCRLSMSGIADLSIPLLRKEKMSRNLLLCTLSLAVVALLLMSSHVRKTSLLGFNQPFDSDVPVQWDSSASSDLEGISRYFSSPSAHMRNRAPAAHPSLKARTTILADVPAHKWSKQHYRDVAVSKVDKQTVNGIWHNEDEAWKGIDEVLPTDTPYSYQLAHVGKGEEAKMEAFLSHAYKQLSNIKKALHQRSDSNSKADKELEGILTQGESALKKIGKHVWADTVNPHYRKTLNDKMYMQATSQTMLRSIPSPQSYAPSKHYESTEKAAKDLNDYFDNLNKKTKMENIQNARRADDGIANTRPGQILHDVESRSKRFHLSEVRSLAEVFVKLMARAMRAEKAQGGQSLEVKPPSEERTQTCQLCVKIMGCADCCEIICIGVDEESKQEEGSATKNASPSILSSLESKLARTPCECQSAECKECPQHDELRKHTFALTASDRSSTHIELAKVVEKNEEIEKASEAVARSNAILRERVAALEATNQMAIRQVVVCLACQGVGGTEGLGAYVPEESDDGWVAREPFPGKSEQVASGFSDGVHVSPHGPGGAALTRLQDLQKQLFGARRKIQRLRQELKNADAAAYHGAEVAAEMRYKMDQARGARSSILRSQTHDHASNSALPFYEQRGYGGQQTARDIRKYEQEERRGTAIPYGETVGRLY
eukprot:745995-Hanusia_phi.AAC.1